MAVVRERPILLLAAWACIASATMLLLVSWFMAMTDAWLQEVWPTASLNGWYINKATYYTAFPPVIFGSFFSKQRYLCRWCQDMIRSKNVHMFMFLITTSFLITTAVTFTWTPLLFVALLSIWTRHAPFRSKVKVGQYDATEVAAKPPSAWTAFKHQGKLIFTYQLPPRRLWAFLLDGGLSVLDLLVVLIWFALNFCWIWYGFYLVWDGYELTRAKTGKYTYNTYFRTVCEGLGYGSAWMAVYNLVFVFIPIPRSTFLQYLFNSDFSSIIRYHRWLGHGTLWISLFHGLVLYMGWWSESTALFRHETFAWQKTGINYLAGSVAFFPFGLMLWITTIPIIRRKFFKVFLSTHIIGFLGFVIFELIHYPNSVWYLPGLVIYFMDVTFRLAQWRVTSGMHCTFVSADRTFVTVKLRFNKDARVKTNQFLFLNYPKVGYFDWHPFSIAAAYPNEDGLTQDVIIHIKAYGSWSQNLVKALAEDGTIPVRVDGPYGSASEPEWTHYDHAIMVAGGIGVTPLLGMLRDIQASEKAAEIAEVKLGGREAVAAVPASVNLIWAVKNRDELQLLDQELLATAGKAGSWLRLNLFYTKQDDSYVRTSDEVEGKHPLANPVSNNQTGQNKYHSLQPYGFGDFHWALAHLLAFVGALFCCLAVASYQFEASVTGYNEGKGIRIEAFALLYALALVVGSMGLPAFIIFPLQAIRYKKHVKACEEQQAAQLNGVANGNTNGHANGKSNGHATLSEEQVKRFMPDNMAASGALDLETGRAASVTFGRPNLKKIITEAVDSIPPHQTVGIIASGPSSLVVDARNATSKAAKIAFKARPGLIGVPELSFSNHSFEF